MCYCAIQLKSHTTLIHYFPLLAIIQAWYVTEDGLCRKREVLESDPGQLSGYLRFSYTLYLGLIAVVYNAVIFRHDAVHKMLERLIGDITASRGRALYTGTS